MLVMSWNGLKRVPAPGWCLGASGPTKPLMYVAHCRVIYWADRHHHTRCSTAVPESGPWEFPAVALNVTVCEHVDLSQRVMQSTTSLLVLVAALQI
jgi:hypothetical protein